MSLKSTAKQIFRWFYIRRAKTELRKLRQSSVPEVNRIAEVLEESFYRSLTSEERLWVDVIEDRRAKLNNDPTEINVADFGAVAPGHVLSEEETNTGVLTREPVADVARASKPAFWALILFKLVRHFKPNHVIELGSCVGISAAYQGAALMLNGGGKLITLEGAPEVAEIARQTLEGLELANTEVIAGRFADTLPEVMEAMNPVDYVFVDGHHRALRNPAAVPGTYCHTRFRRYRLV